MHCSATVAREGHEVVARAVEYPACVGRGRDRDEALKHLRAALVYWLESCPCDHVVASDLAIEIAHDTS